MILPPGHWQNPRAAIGAMLTPQQYEHVGIAQTATAMKAFDDRPSHARTLSVLDFGCGTGAASRALSCFYGAVVGYDPSRECIDAAVDESRPFGTSAATKHPNLSFTRNLPTRTFNRAISFGVFEHLSEDDAETAWDQLRALLAPRGMCLCSFGRKHNVRALSRAAPLIVPGRTKARTVTVLFHAE